MANQLGKRKRARKSEIVSDEENEAEQQRMREVFKLHFETNFDPLPEPKMTDSPSEAEEAEETTSDDDEWSGFSSDNEPIVVEVSQTGTSVINEPEALDKQARKAFMTSKPPAISKTSPSTKNSTTEPASDSENEHENLKNDIALQRLLRESHLLTPSLGRPLEPHGRVRLKALDIRLQSIGGGISETAQSNMPMKLRKGINAKREATEGKRRAEARENGVVLEREVKVKKREGWRERGVGNPAVGKFRGGMLSLSRRDIQEVTGRGGRGGGRSGKGRFDKFRSKKKR